jgi:hypothetical protein
LLNSNYQLCLRAIVLSSVLALTGCIASAPGSGGGGGGGSQPLTVTVSPSTTPPMSVPVSVPNQPPSTVQFSATVSPSSSSQGVTWSLVSGNNSSCSASNNGLGAITSSGLYTAPSTISAAPCTVAVTATSTANTSDSGFAPIALHVVVSISPATDTIGQGANLQYVATVIGTPTPTSDQTVNWAPPSCPTCPSGQTGGAFDPINLGLYVAPDLEEGVTSAAVVINAGSTFDPNAPSGTANITVQKTDPLGSAAPTTAGGAMLSTCPPNIGGVSNATCYQVNTSCDGVADYSVYLKVNTPAGTPKGTVIFGTGTGGSALYDNDPEFFYNNNNNTTNGGLAVVQGVLNAGYTTVQISFGSPFNATPGTVNGWLQGPGGVRRLACRYATVADWVSKNQQALSPNLTTSAPLCATANSGGSGAIGYALTVYGLASEFAMVEPTSGPVMTRLDLGCTPQGTQGNTYGGKTACTNPLNLDMAYSTAGSSDGTAGIIDTAYQSEGSTTPTLCSDGVNGISSSNALRFLSDSIDYGPNKSPAILIPNPPTTVNVVFGGQDSSNAVGQGETWWASIGPMGGPKPTQACVQDAPHPIPAAPSGDGVTQIVNDITTLCVAH